MNSIKITSGILRGRKINTPGGATHPMGERERLALFNMIVDFIPGASVLDAFAGSGALGIEALSRGASSVVFIEKNAKACAMIRDNLRDLGLNADVFQGDVVNFTPDNEFDLVLADPPYDKFDINEVKHLLKFLRGGGVLVLSHPKEAPDLPGLKLLKSRKYAGATIYVYVKG